mmetsp:Transcript_38901/g.59112  ORF Transcript_38901/g.59112 Transcript_38901/m.59112 type:complete len:161 (+) Transcript_38901:761-1243(+)
MVPVYKSDPPHDDLTPDFKKIEEKMQKLCNSDDKCLLRFSVMQHDEDDGEHKMYGFCTTTLRLIIDNNGKDFPLYDKKGNQTGVLKFQESRINEQPSFAEYLKSGWHINLSVAIDYTASNGDPKDPDSLHHTNEREDGKSMNQYEEAMTQVGTILETYAF